MTKASRSIALVAFFALGTLMLAGANDRPTAAPTREVASFKQNVSAFLEKHCFQCHGEKVQKADLKLSVFKDEAALQKDRKTWKKVLDAVREGEMPPSGKPRPTAAEMDALAKTVNELFAAADKNAKPDPGKVTVRRLNRVEYNNTIRDLVGVDFNPAEDFPADDIGYGFDNIGDVLSLSPVLMERYLAAAESIVSRAITPVPPKPPNRGVGTQYTEPAGPNVPMKNNHRVVSGKKDGTPVETGPIFTRYKVPSDGQYIAHTQVYVETSGTKPVKVALLAGCEKGAKGVVSDAEFETISGAAAKNLRPFIVLKTFEIKARNEKTAEILKADIPADIGLDKLAVALVKADDGEPAPTLYVRYMSLEGPLDTRPASHRRLLACDASKPKAEQTREVLRRFASRAYRRPATNDEVERLATLVEAAVKRGEKWEAGVQLAMQAVLVSPKFLFRLELESPLANAGGSLVPIGEFALASRLSYFLWSTMPDDELFGLAEKKQLTANLDAQIKRMLLDPKSKALTENFALQWLQLRRLQTFAPDPKLFPNFDDRLRRAMLRETEMFFDAIVREDRGVLDLIDADYTFLNERLARHYGIIDTVGNAMGQKPAKPGGKPIPREEFVRVSLQGGSRGGLLTQASVLTVTSNPTRTSPVKRGRWVLEQILGTPPPTPPADVPELPEDEKATLSGSLRQRMEQHRKNPSCANCHARMDPLGFAFENFNAIGAFRAKDGEFAIDPSGTLPDGKSFKGPEELKAILMGKKELFVRCLAEKMLTYAVGRGLEHYDTRAIDQICERLAKAEYRFSSLVSEIVKCEPFRYRRGTEQQP